MGRLLTRITIVLVAIYFIVAHIYTQFFGIDILNNSYTLLFELIVVVQTFSSGKYHCKYIKYVALAIFLCELISVLDYRFDFIGVNAYNAIPIAIIALSITYAIYKAIRHYVIVRKIKRRKSTYA